ncbi:hypothetical protein KNP414_07763 [Paenibacillus mucilaginosus KNP414]|uniref:Uncharacterized protein n=1 Tax=Paenibacillus mucilaginosus (strain KNP414) TaxID=1036673 RepID=F8FGU8_PAEMK|nr:hypothetical protein KNP414_07763 [Paenibacillus mucilaginosus KNP414]
MEGGKTALAGESKAASVILARKIRVIGRTACGSRGLNVMEDGKTVLAGGAQSRSGHVTWKIRVRGRTD